MEMEKKFTASPGILILPKKSGKMAYSVDFPKTFSTFCFFSIYIHKTVTMSKYLQFSIYKFNETVVETR